MSSTRSVIEYAKRNGGVFMKSEAIALGLSESALKTRVRDGVFVRVARGVYALPGTATRPDLMIRAASRSLGAVVSHESAGLLHGLQPIVVVTPTVTVSHRSTHTFPGVLVHQSTDLLESHLTTLDGLPVTTPERTVVDLAQKVAPARLARIVDNGLAARTLDLDNLVELHQTLARRGKPGGPKLRRVLERRTGPPPVPETELEFRLRSLIERAGLPQPVSQFHAPWLKPINGRVDLAYVDHRLIIEADSRRWHVLLDAFETDRRRDNAAQIAGWRVLRFTWDMIENHPWEVIETIRGALQTPAA